MTANSKFQVFNLINVLLLTLLSNACMAQETTQEEDVNRLIYLNSLYIQSFVHSDTATYDKLLWADDFMQQNSNGTLLNKDKCMVRFGKPRFDSIDYFYADNVQIRFITKDVAMIHARSPYGIRTGDSISTGADQYNDVYVRRNGNWICVSANIINIKNPEKAKAAH